MSVDANLGSGKADAGMDVTMNLKIDLRNPAKPEAEFKKNFAYVLNLDNPQFAESLYVYRNYHRLYVPEGSFVYASFGGQNDVEGGLDFEKEQEIVSAGTYLYLKKGDKKTLLFQYYLAPEIVDELEKGRYSIYLQKQPGTSRPLSIKILLPKDWKDFKINFSQAQVQNNIVTINTDLSIDREITITKK